MGLTVVVNGQSRGFESLSAGVTLDRLVAEMGLVSDRVAVELNGEIASRGRWGLTAVGEGDRLEVVHFVGGGCSGKLAPRFGCLKTRRTHVFS